MATKFGYVERQATNNIDWSAIGSQVVQNLQEEAAIREAKKDAIDQASREMAEILRNSPTGENLTMNEFTLDYANNAQQLLLQQDRLLKAGLLNPKDYAVVRANLNESTNELFNLSKEYQAEYESKMARLKNGESQELEAFLMASTEGLANLKNGKALIDPSTGVVSIGTWVDGKMDGDPSSYATVNEVRNRIKSYYDKYDTEFEISESVKYLGGYEWVDVIKAQGGGDINQIITNMDPTQKAEYDAWENTVISSMMENKFNVTSMLTDNLDFTAEGKAYGFTFDEQEFNRDKTGSLIFLDRSEDPNGVPVFKPEQEERVREMLRTNVRAQLDKEQSVATSTRAHRQRDPQAASNRSREERQSDAVNLFGQLWYGTQEEKEAAAQSLRGLNRDIASIDASGANGIVITYDDGSKEPISYGTDQARFIERGVNFALSEDDRINDVTKAVQQSSIDNTRTLNTSTFRSRGIAAPEEVTQEQINNQAAKKLYGITNLLTPQLRADIDFAVEEASEGRTGALYALYEEKFNKSPDADFGANKGELD